MIHESRRSHILITSDIENSFEHLKERLAPNRIVSFIEEGEFKLEHAKAVIAESYISEARTKYIILGAKSFNAVSQNALLKILEEPPRHIEFIIISPSKSSLFATIRSRLPVIKSTVMHEVISLELNLLNIDYSSIFTFLKKNDRIGKDDAKELVEALYYRATVTDKLLLSSRQLDNFEMAFRLLEVNSKPQNIFSMLLMGFMNEK